MTEKMSEERIENYARMLDGARWLDVELARDLLAEVRRARAEAEALRTELKPMRRVVEAARHCMETFGVAEHIDDADLRMAMRDVRVALAALPTPAQRTPQPPPAVTGSGAAAAVGEGEAVVKIKDINSLRINALNTENVLLRVGRILGVKGEPTNDRIVEAARDTVAKLAATLTVCAQYRGELDEAAKPAAAPICELCKDTGRMKCGLENEYEVPCACQKKVADAIDAQRTPQPPAVTGSGAVDFVGFGVYGHINRCRHCKEVLIRANYRIADGCVCNSPRGVNHGLVPTQTCTCEKCDPAQTGSTRHSQPGSGAMDAKPPLAVVERGEYEESCPDLDPITGYGFTEGERAKAIEKAFTFLIRENARSKEETRAQADQLAMLEKAVEALEKKS